MKFPVSVLLNESEQTDQRQLWSSILVQWSRDKPDPAKTYLDSFSARKRRELQADNRTDK